MAQVHEGISPDLAKFVTSQKVFFVATAPLKADGLVNLSPKGLETFAVLDEHTVAYLDLTGSGVETAAHLKENGRIVLMWCAFDGPPRIVRFQGRGEVVERDDAEFAELAAKFPARVGVRAVIRVHVTRVATSCGFGVPLMDFRGERSTLDDWCRKLGDDELSEYRGKKNRVSLDGLAGVNS